MSESEDYEELLFRYTCACCQLEEARLRFESFDIADYTVPEMGMTFCGRCYENCVRALRFEGEKSRYKTLEFYATVDEVDPSIYKAFYEEHFPQYAPKAERLFIMGFRDTTVVKLKRPPGGALVKSAFKRA